MIRSFAHPGGGWASGLKPAGMVVFVALCSWAQSSTGQGRSAKQAVELFRKMDSNGERLTTEGWLKVSALFVRPDLLPRERTLLVVTGETVGQEVVTGNRADVWTECTEWGTIDAMARFSRVIGSSGPIKPGEPVEGPLNMRQHYKLVFIDSYWELTRDGGSLSLKEVKGDPAWRIESFDPGRLVAMETAIRYLTTLSSKSSNPVIRKNAEESVAAIQGLRH